MTGLGYYSMRLYCYSVLLLYRHIGSAYIVGGCMWVFPIFNWIFNCITTDLSPVFRPHYIFFCSQMKVNINFILIKTFNVWLKNLNEKITIASLPNCSRKKKILFFNPISKTFNTSNLFFSFSDVLCIYSKFNSI